MLLRSSEIKPLFIDLSPTQQCLKHSLPALFVPPSPLHINPPIANRVRPAMATFPLPWLHHRCRSSLRRALGPATSISLHLSSLLSLLPLFASPSNTASFDNSHCPFSLSHLLSSLDPSSLLFRIAWWLWPPSLQSPTINPPHSLPFRSLSTLFAHDATLALFVALCADSCRESLCFSAPHTPQRQVTPSRQPRNPSRNLATPSVYHLFRICALALQFAWPLPSRSHFASPH